MTTTIQAGALRAALKKAQSVGRVEEEVIIDDCQLVLQSLTPEEYVAINAETEGLEDLEYFNGFIAAHVSRAVCEIDGQDLRGVEFIEDAAPPGTLVWGVFPSEDIAKQVKSEIEKAGGQARVVPAEASGQERMVRYERHDWLYQNVLSQWSREALNVGWRKFAEVLKVAEEKAKTGVDFRVPEETNEDQYRRLVNELQEIGSELPIELTNKILKDAGLITISSAEELQEATARLDQLAATQEAPQEPSQAEAPVEPSQAQQAAPAAPQAAPAAPQASTPPTPEQLHEMMANRQPLNRRASGASPPRPQPTSQQVAVPARERAQVPDQIRQAAMANTAAMSNRAAQIAAIEGAVDPSIQVPAGGGQLPVVAPEDVPILEAKTKPIEGSQVAAITEQPPPIGINPRFKPPPR